MHSTLREATSPYTQSYVQLKSMSRFKNIDVKLDELSARLGTNLTKDRPGSPEVLRTFEERRIDWVEDGINKAIIIQPTFEITGVNLSIWNFINLAWIKKNGVAQKPGWAKNLITKMDFKVIEENIDILLNESLNNLKTIKIEDVINKKST